VLVILGALAFPSEDQAPVPTAQLAE